MINWKSKFLFAVILLSLVPQLMAIVPERRSKEGSDEFGWFAAPTPIRIEGIGQALPFFALLSNVYESTDLILVKTMPGGDFDISGALVDDLPVFTRHLQFTGGIFNAKVPVIQYNRGIDSDPDDYIQPLVDQRVNFYQARLLFWEDRLDIFYQQMKGEVTTLKVFDNKGNLLSSTATTDSFDAVNYGIIMDLTDDQTDPRSGVRVGMYYKPTNSGNAYISDVMVTDTNLTGYIPLFGKDTLLLNLFTSTSSITRSGVTDEASARIVMNQGCLEGSDIYEACLAGEDKLVSDFLDYNHYGLATPLGGPNRLRGYPQSRFKAGNSSYRGIEYRYNLGSEPTNINWYFLGGVNTLLQVAVFYEQGTVSEESLVLNNNLKSSYGAGLRALISGFVYRFDVATGDEGTNLTLFIDYPMALNPIVN